MADSGQTPLPEGANGNTPPQDAQQRKSKAKIRTIRIWLWVTALLFAGFFFLSQCAMSKPQLKAQVVSSCIDNVPFSPKWQADLAGLGLAGQSERLIEPYCRCVWEPTLDKLNHKQIENFSSLNSAQQLELFGGEAAFIEHDRQCVAQLKSVLQ